MAKMGRPTENPVNNQFRVRLTDEDKDYLEQKAEESGLTKSEYIRIAIRKLANGEGKNIYLLLSEAVDLANEDKFEKALAKVHEADKYASGDNKVYDNLRQAVMITIMMDKRLSRKK